MKQLTKEQVYVLIDNQPDCDRAIDILTKAGEKMWSDVTSLMFNKDDKYLVIDTEGEWLIDIDRMIDNRIQVTLDELERILMPKIKKAELLERIEKLESVVKDLTEKTNKVTIFHPAEFVGDRTKEFKVVFGDTKQEAEKPAFEVGKVYKGENAIMFYCTKVKDGRPYGFGFSLANDWMEDDDEYWDDYFTEATPEEWFNRLEEEAKKRGFKRGVIFNSPKPKYEFSFNQKIIKDNFEWNIVERVLRCSTDKNEYGGNVMKDGKWAEIIEEPKYQAGTLGAFWDGEWDEAVDEGNVFVGYFEKQATGHYYGKQCSWDFQNFKPLKFD